LHQPPLDIRIARQPARRASDGQKAFDTRKRVYLKAWREAHRAERRAYDKQWVEKNRERVNELQRKRYVRKRKPKQTAQ
jgi:hypothetical protein